MKRMKIGMLGLLIAFFWIGGIHAQQKVVRILAIGNSFSQDAVEQNLHELAAADGFTAVIGNLFIGGCSLERHVKNARNDTSVYAYRKIGMGGKKVERRNVSLAQALADEQWDYVSLQQASSFSGMYATYAASLPELVSYVKERIPRKTKLMLHQTWAYAASASHSGFRNYDNDQLTMYHAIVEAVKKAGRLAKIKIIIPSGTAIQNMRTSFVGDHMNRDGFHLNLTTGRYTAACTWYEKIFKRKVVGNPYAPQGMSEEERKVAQQAAHKAVLHPGKITEMSGKYSGTAVTFATGIEYLCVGDSPMRLYSIDE